MSFSPPSHRLASRHPIKASPASIPQAHFWWAGRHAGLKKLLLSFSSSSSHFKPSLKSQASLLHPFKFPSSISSGISPPVPSTTFASLFCSGRLASTVAQPFAATTPCRVQSNSRTAVCRAPHRSSLPTGLPAFYPFGLSRCRRSLPLSRMTGAGCCSSSRAAQRRNLRLMVAQLMSFWRQITFWQSGVSGGHGARPRQTPPDAKHFADDRYKPRPGARSADSFASAQRGNRDETQRPLSSRGRRSWKHVPGLKFMDTIMLTFATAVFPPCPRQNERKKDTHKVTEDGGRKQIVQARFAIRVVGYSAHGIGRLSVHDVEVACPCEDD
ncbi:hypothetical protein FB451DRAFT_1360005 [Mycena latifolia]|nr:hypothetical protein FB451DRAFT_1360005 [Mycena latifolia]